MSESRRPLPPGTEVEVYLTGAQEHAWGVPALAAVIVDDPTVWDGHYRVRFTSEIIVTADKVRL